VIIGGIGFPVLLELRRELGKPCLWSVHTKTTVWTTALLLGGGTAAVTAFEWRNPGTLGPLSVPEKLLVASSKAASSREPQVQLPRLRPSA
jgi:trk system potassium uptake protein TrkH